MYCANCGKELIDGNKFCPNCGTTVNGEIKQECIKSEVESKDNKISVNLNPKIIIAIVTTLILVIVVIIILVATSGKRRANNFFNDIENGNNLEAGKYYRQIIENNPEKIYELSTKIDERIDDILLKYAKGKLSYQEARGKIDNYFNYFPEESLEAISELEKIQESNRSFERGERYFDSENYVEAIENYKLVIADDKNYEKSLEKIEKSNSKLVERMISSAEKNASKKDIDGYILAIENLKRNHDVLNADSIKKLNEKIETYSKEYEKLVLEKAKELGNNKDLIGAISMLNEGFKVYPTGAFTPDIEKYQSEFVELKLNEAKTQKDNGNIEEAVSILSEAHNLCKDTLLEKTISDYSEYLPKDIFNLECISENSISHRETDNDKYGNEYRNVIHYNSSPNIGEPHVEFVVPGKCNRFSGTLFLSSRSNSKDVVNFKIYADDKLIYESGEVTYKTKPINFDIDIINAERIRISSEAKRIYLFYADSALANGKFYYKP